jgi:hypothetical protein
MMTRVRPAQPGLLRVCAHVAGASGLTRLRILLAADVLLRAAGLRRLQVLTVLTSEDQTAPLERAAGALGIHPPAARAAPGAESQALAGPVDVHLAASDAEVTGGIVERVGAARGPQDGDPGDPGGPGGSGDPHAVRLALLGFRWDEPAGLTEDALSGACQTLSRWRRRVADWANSPSRPVPAAVTEQIRAAAGDLDTVSLLALLSGLASDEALPPGARFETFLYADRLLGLELPREIGTLARTAHRRTNLDP